MTALSHIVLVTGMTGAGRGSSCKVLEKLGFFVIDNLPPHLISQAVDAVIASADVDKLAIAVDSRSRDFFSGVIDEIEALRARGIGTRILFLEAADDVLVRRQEAARRPHPLSHEGRLMDGFDRERELLRRLRGRADIVIDTTNLNSHQLAQRVHDAFVDAHSGGLRATVMSFGFKYGIPIDADMVADLRFLPNPYWVEELRPMSGLDAPVSEYVLAQPRTSAFIDQYEQLVALLTDGYLREDKHFLTIAIGCTGGRHRSVAVSEALAERIRANGVRTMVVHRDLGRE
jgi:UPF0042 nucleotide-binding protein